MSIIAINSFLAAFHIYTLQEHPLSHTKIMKKRNTKKKKKGKKQRTPASYMLPISISSHLQAYYIYICHL